MDASRGIKIELSALLTGTWYAIHLQPEERQKVLHAAILDGLITRLMPHPDYLDNKKYPKYAQQRIIVRDKDGIESVVTQYTLNPEGTFFKSKTGAWKQNSFLLGTRNIKSHLFSSRCSKLCFLTCSIRW